jgi:tetratricopeptide (TPR) repeat protein
LPAKAEACFAASKDEPGQKALIEARDLFLSVGNIHWFLRCCDLRIRLCFQAGNGTEALALCVHSVGVAAASGSHVDYVDALLKMAVLCREYGMDVPAAEFVKQAKELAKDHQLPKELVRCLMAEADALRDESNKEARESLVHEAITALEPLAEKCEVKGRRAWFLAELGGLHARLGDLVEARMCFSEALHLYEEIGGMGGTADCLGSLAAAARQEKDRERPSKSSNAYLQEPTASRSTSFKPERITTW